MANVITSGSVHLQDPLAYFPNFLWKTWGTLLRVEPSPLLYDFAHYLDGGYLDELRGHAEKGDVGARKILMAFRGAAKSWTTTSYAVCRLRRNRSDQVLCVSATGAFAGSIATFAFNMVRNFDWLADMKPGNEQRQSALAFDVAGAPVAKDESFASSGLFGQITGRRALTIIGDDLEVPNTSDTELARQRLRARMAEFGAIIKPGGDIYLLGTAQTEDTVYKEYAEEKGYELRIYPAQFPRIDSIDPKKDERKKYGARLAPFILNQVEANPFLGGTTVEPRFTEADLMARRKEWGTTEYERQFLMYLDAGGGKDKPLKLRDLVVLEMAPPTHSSPELRLPSELTWAPTPPLIVPDLLVDALTGDSHAYMASRADVYLPAEEIVCFVDTSGEGTDETTWAIGAGLEGRVFLLHLGASIEGHTASTLEAIAKDCKRWGVQLVEVEANFGGGMFGDLLTPKLADIHHVCAVETIPAGGTMKEKRIVDTLHPLTTDHRLVVNAQVLRDDYRVDYPQVEERERRFYRLTYQLTRMVAVKGAVRHDDRLDAVSGLCRHFIGVLLRQLKDVHEAGRAQAIELEAEKMIDSRRKQGLHLWGLEKLESAFGRPTPRKSSKKPTIN